MKPVSSLVKVFAREDFTAIDEETKGSCLLNERYDFQVCICGSESLEGLSLEIAGVNGDCTVYSVREIKAGFESFSGGDEYMLHSEDKMYPELLEELEADRIYVTALLLKPDVYDKDVKLDYVAMEIPNRFIVGFGLDYDELGRNIRDIYVIEE